MLRVARNDVNNYTSSLQGPSGRSNLILIHMERGGSIYILTNKKNTTLYTGVSSDLRTRIYRHRNNFYPRSFTSRYKLYRLVYYENFHSIEEAIAREKQIKGGSRKKKVELINGFNPKWIDLSTEIEKW